MLKHPNPRLFFTSIARPTVGDVQTQSSKMLKFSLLVVGFVFWSSDLWAWAVQMEYHTFNGFTPIEAALQKITLVFSDLRYHALFFPIILGGGLLSFIRSIIKALGNPSQGVSFLAGLVPMTTGALIYLTLIVPKGTLILHDDVLNKNRVFDQLPQAVVLTMGSVNSVERGMMDIFQTTTDPAGNYLLGAGGIGFDLVGKIAGGDFLSLGDKLMQASLSNYMSDCLLFELSRTGTAINVNTIQSTDDWIGVLDQAVNPAVYTLMFTTTNPEGVQMTCTDAWTGAGGLKGYFNNPANLETIRKNVCSDAGLNADNAQEYLSCQNIIDEHMKIAASNNTNPVASMDYIRQAYMARSLDQALSSGADTAAMAYANRNLMTQGLSTAMIAHQYMPVIRGVLTSIVILLLPILVLLLPTFSFSKVMNLIVGFFVFLASWGVVDSAMYSHAVTMAMGFFRQVAMHHTGYAAIMLTPDAAAQALGAIGMMQTASITLATVIAGVFGFGGGAVIAGLSGQVMSPVSQGASQAASVSTPEGRSRARSELESAWTSETVANVRPELASRSMAGNQLEGLAGSEAKLDHGAVTQEQAAENVRRSQAEHQATKEGFGRAGKDFVGGSAELAGNRAEQEAKQHSADSKLAQQNGFRTAAGFNIAQQTHEKETMTGRQQADDMMSDKLNMGQQQYSKWKASGSVLNAQQAETLQKEGYNWANAGMSMQDVKLDEKGDIRTGHVSDQITGSNLKDYQYLYYNQEYNDAMGKLGPNATPQQQMEAEQSAAEKSSRLVPGMMVSGNIGADGQGEWEFAKGAKAHETYTSSQTDSLKNIKQREDTDQTTIQKGLDANVYQAALAGDTSTLSKMVAATHNQDGIIDRGRQAVLVDNLADHIEKSFNMSQGSQKSAGVEAHAGVGTPKLFGVFDAGTSGRAEYNRNSSEQNDVLRNRLHAEMAELNKKFEGEYGGLTPEAYDKEVANWLKGTAQKYHNRGIEREDGSTGGGFFNAAGNLGSDILESGKDTLLSTNERMKDGVNKGSDKPE